MSRAFVLDRVEYDRFSRCKQFERLFYNDCNKSVAMKAFLTTSEPRTQRGALFIALQIYGYELHRGLGYREAKYKRHRAALKSSLFIICKAIATPIGGGFSMTEKLPAPCEPCKGTGLSHGSECQECRGKGYRLIIEGRPMPVRQPAKPTRWQSRPPNRR